MSIPDFGDDLSPRRPTPVRPSHTARGRRLLQVPWQAFEVSLLDHRVRSEEDFRRFCMFGHPAPEPMPGCAQPVRIGAQLYDAEALRNLYIAQGVGAAIERVFRQARDSAGAPKEPPAPAMPVERAVAGVRQAALLPLVRDALLIEICSMRNRALDAQQVGCNLATLAFEVFLADPAPHELPERLAAQLADEGLVRCTEIELLGRMQVYGPREMGGAVVRNSLLPRWRPMRLRQSRAHDA